ncbi:hypothetical protein SAMN06297468_2325 [Altererythrobacter xiamenensis]|uniref:Uncharacterized protein n=1 Tax=Altererythrobacter xiamenensis TaxID=1316679 RepID=A0A1Y6FGK6_9SPHN|nr:hypothetical protein [Altererythrobacter xiamenensis]SMQ73809.1 hypothetical protein SAMN06297468_2325 [Altererythrobacter xiamenensis]
MPNIDVDTYFFTALAPVCNEGIVEHDGVRTSPIELVREVLETMPTALQTPATERLGINSPFSRNSRTHFARFVVIDQPNFNGRPNSNAIIDAIANTDLVKPGPIDQLSCPYIMVMIDFDLLEPSGKGDPRSYFEELWQQMEPELRSVFQYCYGFDEVESAADFASYMIRCQVETTMSFHDYWWEAVKVPTVSTALLIALPALAIVLPVIAALLGWLGWHWAVALAVLLLILAVFIDYKLIMHRGEQPMPAAPGTKLPDVLKGLYLQQAFTRFAEEQQPRDLAQRGAAFRSFLQSVDPANLEGPTQPPGVVRSKLEGGNA